MMDEDNRNHDAFPSQQEQCQDGTWNQTYCSGMSMRQYYAGKALPALITAMLSRRNEADFADFDKAAIVEAARFSVVAADAILHALAESEAKQWTE